MDNIVTDLRIKISALEIENAALKRKIDQMYKDWLYDANKYTELKQLVKELTKAVPAGPCANQSICLIK